MKYSSRIAGFICSALIAPSLFAIDSGKIIIADPKLGSRSIVYEKADGFAVVEGDILIGKLSNLTRQGAMVTKQIHGTRWVDGVIPYEIDPKLPFKNKLAVLQAIDQWQDNSNLRFVELNCTNHDEYSDYISFIPAGGTTCSSYVGKVGGKQEINLSPRCHTMNTVHEIGHALGLWHEQSRTDRDSYIRILWENIEEEHKYNFNQQLNDGEDVGEYDYQSIMHYGPMAFSKNMQPTIVPLVENTTIGQRVKLSDKDIAAVKAMYPKSEPF